MMRPTGRDRRSRVVVRSLVFVLASDCSKMMMTSHGFSTTDPSFRRAARPITSLYPEMVREEDSFWPLSEETEVVDPIQRALQRAEERNLDEFIENKAPAWMQGRASLPFACTACGRCCQTEGDVYMSPEEIQEAARVAELTSRQFVQTYASHMLGPTEKYDETTTWIRLKEKDGSCVFLGNDGKFCSIYEARPVQCRTYPFWPNIMQSVRTWEDECRRRDDDTDNPLPPWTPVDGGCEGMKIIDSAFDGDDEGVPLREAYRQLNEYIIADQRFPKGTERLVTVWETGIVQDNGLPSQEQQQGND